MTALVDVTFQIDDVYVYISKLANCFEVCWVIIKIKVIQIMCRVFAIGFGQWHGILRGETYVIALILGPKHDTRMIAQS